DKMKKIRNSAKDQNIVTASVRNSFYGHHGPHCSPPPPLRLCRDAPDMGLSSRANARDLRFLAAPDCAKTQQEPFEWAQGDRLKYLILLTAQPARGEALEP